MRRDASPVALSAAILAGDRLALARGISQVEDGTPAARELLRLVFPHSGRAHLVGVTGAPGTGKSSLVTELVRLYREAGKRVAVLAVDPTSPFSGGALLGDRVRMTKLSGDPDLYIRSMATRGALGGIARATNDAVHLLDGAGFDPILIETVGVGQAEVEIAGVAHTTVVVEAPGLGDEVQAIKAGVLEIGDIFVVNKADRPGLQRTLSALEMMIHQGSGRTGLTRHHGVLLDMELPAAQPERGWLPPLLQTIAIRGDGVADLRQAIDRHGEWLTASGERGARERLRLARTVEQLVQIELLASLRRSLPRRMLAELIEAVSRRELDPYTAAEQLLRQM